MEGWGDRFEVRTTDPDEPVVHAMFSRTPMYDSESENDRITNVSPSLSEGLEATFLRMQYVTR